MDIEEIKTLTDLMVDHDLSEIMIRDGDKRIVIRRGDRGVTQVSTSPPGGATPAPAGGPAAPQEDPNLAKVSSPMVGTFYATPDPDSPPYVNIGTKVGPDSVVCIIEAMKVFNEIKAEHSGTIESIEMQSGDPVEFGQVIMTVRVG
jgi:acetyl-CoA carboxylase biotin carboxyl carrier protein